MDDERGTKTCFVYVPSKVWKELNLKNKQRITVAIQGKEDKWEEFETTFYSYKYQYMFYTRKEIADFLGLKNKDKVMVAIRKS